MKKEAVNEYVKMVVKELEELKAYKEIGTVEECRNSVLDIQKAYNKAIDDFLREIKIDVIATTFGLRICDAERIAQQLKAGDADV